MSLSDEKSIRVPDLLPFLGPDKPNVTVDSEAVTAEIDTGHNESRDWRSDATGDF